MGLLNLLFGSSNDADDQDDQDSLFTSVFGNPGDTTKDEDLASGDYKEDDWYD
ncbi:hypothetical protein RGQ13_00620 [Thalassotalea psychrophila]|uniref:Uncharacterized protein n=1 Tax=Thalassotalea psychrophila TaxID=3065647 RepID=A0ABY9TUJ7_9GAMM|nr:hypothetical protein RGQ13_00620 [Colwelliaceae bacterium SQ149]